MCLGVRMVAQAKWSFGTQAPRASCVMTPGTWLMLRLCATSWAVARPWMQWRGLPLDLDQDLCGWMKWGAVAVRHYC